MTAHRAALLLALAVGFALPGGDARAGAFISAGETTPDRITHPTGYTGSGGTLTVDVCIDSTSVNAADMVIPVQNAITTYNNSTVHQGNVVFGGDVVGGRIDFESVFVHELGHCIGLAHSNLASESGLPIADQDYVKSADGTNNVYDLDDGADNVLASGDDLRGDDVNFYWYENDVNNPYVIDGSVVDSTTYSRLLTNLPAGDTFAASGHRGNASTFGVSSTEAVMNQGTFSSEEQRLITADDVSALRYAQSGLDSTAGTSDDYTLVLNYAGSSPNPGCDINVDFDDAQTGFAVCAVSTAFVTANHRRVSSANIFMNTGFMWYFGQETCGNGMFEGTETCDDGNVSPNDGCNQTCVIEPGWACSGAPSTCSEICGDNLVRGAETCDDGGTTPGDGCDASCQVESGWMCSGEPSICSGVCGDGLILGVESCDDGGTAPGDGCDASCQVESGWLCSGEPSICSGICGDALIRGAEACDDGALATGDGCDPFCQIEPGWMCSGEPSTCGGICGDGLIRDAEICDDGGTTPGDGCDELCQIEPGYSCVGEPTVCTAAVDALDLPARLLLALGLMGLGATWLAIHGARRRAT